MRVETLCNAPVARLNCYRSQIAVLKVNFSIPQGKLLARVSNTREIIFNTSRASWGVSNTRERNSLGTARAKLPMQPHWHRFHPGTISYIFFYPP
jgi:hypothetical protein